MSFFDDLFGSGYQKAANTAATGYNAAYGAATPSYQAALAPYTNLSTSATQGVDAYKAALGIGTTDPAAIQKQVEATPGYQFELGQGLKAIDRSAASRGLATSGNTLEAEQQYGSGLAGKYYGNYLSSLAPFIGQQTTAAGGVSGVQGNIGNAAYNTQAAIGNTQAAADIATQNAENSFVSGIANLGGKLLGNVNYTPTPGYGSSGGGGGGGGGSGYNPSQFTQSGLYTG